MSFFKVAALVSFVNMKEKLSSYCAVVNILSKMSKAPFTVRSDHRQPAGVVRQW